MKAWLGEQTDSIEEFYLPSYAPELNPDEHLNADMQHAIGAKKPVRTKSKLKAAAEEHMTTIGRSPERGRPTSRIQGSSMPHRNFIGPDQ